MKLNYANILCIILYYHSFLDVSTCEILQCGTVRMRNKHGSADHSTTNVLHHPNKDLYIYIYHEIHVGYIDF